MFGGGKDLKTADNPKKKRKGLKNKAGILAAKKDTPAELEGLTKARNRNLVPEGEDIDKNVLDSDLLEKKCDLCERPRPIFVVDTDDMIKRLPERFLSPLLKNLKKDFNNKRQYLKFLRINAKYIKACNCEDKQHHAYCVTAQVVRTQKIYCKDCGAYYHLYVKSEKLCSSQLFTVIGRYICLFILLIAFAQATLLLDSFLKQNHRDDDETLVDTTSGFADADNDGIDDSVDTSIFSVYNIQNWIVMAPLTIILGIIMVWCFYFRFMKAVMARKRLIWVEVLDQKNSDIFISRFLAKQNLHLVGEVTQKLRSYNYLFDKYWYRQREFQYIDAISNVEQQQFSNNLTETNIKDLDQENKPQDIDEMGKNHESQEKPKENKLDEEAIEQKEAEKSKNTDEVDKKTHPANESKDSMNFGGLIAL